MQKLLIITRYKALWKY